MGKEDMRTCQNCGEDFPIFPEDLGFYEKMDVPPPTFCYLCRAQRRFAFRNDRALYKRTSDLSGETVFSTFPDDVPFPVYTTEEWFSDQWDPLEYGRDYDFSRPFFEQFKELSDRVPKPSKSVAGFLINSEYSNNASNLKNCYLIFNSGYDEDCAYGNAVMHSQNSFDNTLIHKCEVSYECFGPGTCSRIFFCTNVSYSSDLYFSRDLKGCTNCFGCANLRNKSYHIFNKPYSKDEYEKKLQEFNLGSYASLQRILKETGEFLLRFPTKFAHQGTKSVDVLGEYIFHAKNVKYSYFCVGGEDLRYCQYVSYPPTKDCYDHSVYGEGSELSYECAMTGEKTHNTKFCVQAWTDIRNTEYCEYCRSSSDCFGCVGIRNKQYCVLNKQYSKDEYHSLVSRIKKHMDEMPYKDKKGRVYRYGEFFPAEFSPYGYNETIANEHFPLNKDEIMESGYNWRDYERSRHPATLQWSDIPDHIHDVDESLLNETIGCMHRGACDQGCTEAFRLIPSELAFYKRFSIPVPRLCPNCRHWERLKRRNSMRLYPGKCQCAGYASGNGVYTNISDQHPSHKPEEPCPNEFQTAFTPDRKEILYCRECYQQEVV